jgi:5,10-methylenetetrahydromethanopterin reductase
MRIDLRVPVGRPLPELAAFVARCEDAGLDGVGIHDHPHSGRDVYVALALAAQRTRRLALYPATSSPVARHPLLLASLAASLAECAPGRTWLTVAPGLLAVRSMGRPRAGVAAMREAVLAIRRLLAGEAVAVGATTVRLGNVPVPPPPVYLLAAGPRMVELAGEVADGACLMVGLHPAGVAAARRHLAEGARRAGRDLSGFPTIFVVTLALAETREAAREWPRRWFAPGQPFLAYPSASNLHWLREAGLAVPEGGAPDAIGEALAGEICEAFGLFGPPEHCAERLQQAREEAGIDHVFLFPAHDLAGGYAVPAREVDAIERVIRPRLTGAAGGRSPAR